LIIKTLAVCFIIIGNFIGGSLILKNKIVSEDE